MSRLEAVLRQAGALLDELGFRWALVGGLAVSARTEPRFTRDVDLAVALSDDDQAEDLVRQFRARGYELVAAVEQEAVGRFATARLLPEGGADTGAVVDLLFASSGIESEIASEAEPLEILSGLTVPVAQTGHLLALKLLSRDDESRPQDTVDLRALLADASEADRALARRALLLVTQRGFHRNRDLEDLFEALVASPPC